MVNAEMLDYYSRGLERDRLAAGCGRVEFMRMRELLQRFLPAAPAALPDGDQKWSPDHDLPR